MSGGRIVHVSADFPDSIVPAKTHAIAALIELVADRFDHDVLSLNRVTPGIGHFLSVLGGQASIASDWRAEPLGESLRYAAPPRGLFHRSMLLRLADALHARIEAGGKGRPALLVGHKLTVEGIVVAEVARRLGVPYALSIQGNTDSRILAARPDLARHFASVFHGAAVVFPFAPWALARAEARLGKRQGPTMLLPCPVALDQPLAPVTGGEGLVTAFHLRNQAIKNLPRMAAALEQARRAVPGLTLGIVGGGSEADLASVQGLAARTPGLAAEGSLPNAAMAARYNRAAGFVLPSLHESFGMVFVEALFAGCPIIYPKGRAVDGYFDGLPFAIGVDPLDTPAIAGAMQQLIREEASLKSALRDWQASDHARQFQRPTIATRFAEGLSIAMGRQSDSSAKPL